MHYFFELSLDLALRAQMFYDTLLYLRANHEETLHLALRADFNADEAWMLFTQH